VLSQIHVSLLSIQTLAVCSELRDVQVANVTVADVADMCRVLHQWRSQEFCIGGGGGLSQFAFFSPSLFPACFTVFVAAGRHLCILLQFPCWRIAFAGLPSLAVTSQNAVCMLLWSTQWTKRFVKAVPKSCPAVHCKRCEFTSVLSKRAYLIGPAR